MQTGGKALPSRVARAHWLVSYVIAVDLTAVALALATHYGLPRGGWGTFVLFVAVATLTESWAVTMPGRGSFSFCFAANFTAAVVFGPCLGVLVAGAATLLAEGLIWRAGFMKTAFNTGQLALAAGVAGLVFHALQVGAGFSLTTNAAAYIMAGLAYLLVNSALAAGIMGLLGGGLMRSWLSAVSQAGVFYLAMAPLGCSWPAPTRRAPGTLLYFPLLLWVIHQGFEPLHAPAYRDGQGAGGAGRHHRPARPLHLPALGARGRACPAHRHAPGPARRTGRPGHTAAQVHDLGKISIDNRILLKEGPLTPEERAQIKKHSAAGAELAGQFSMYDEGAAIIRHHHERWDGTATRTGWPARRSLWAPASSPWPTSTTP